MYPLGPVSLGRNESEAPKPTESPVTIYNCKDITSFIEGVVMRENSRIHIHPVLETPQVVSDSKIKLEGKIQRQNL